jgi:hypothetical protein
MTHPLIRDDKISPTVQRVIALGQQYVAPEHWHQFTLDVLDLLHETRIDQIDRSLAIFQRSLDRNNLTTEQLHEHS